MPLSATTRQDVVSRLYERQMMIDICSLTQDNVSSSFKIIGVVFVGAIETKWVKHDL